MLTDEERLRETRLIESYKEQTASWRHFDDIYQRLKSIYTPLSFSALFASYVYDHIPCWLPIVVGSMLMVFLLFSFLIHQNKADIRFRLIHDMERDMKIEGHTKWTEMREKDPYGNILKGKYLQWIIFILYFFTAGLIMWHKCYSSC